jgi:hypothetical protein
MYQAPPPARVWTARHWIAAIAGGAIGAGIAMAIIVVAGGVVSAGLRGIAMGAVQAFVMIWAGRGVKPRPPRRTINRSAVIVVALIGVGAVAYLVGMDLSEGGLPGDRTSMTLAIFGTLFGVLPVWSRFRQQVERDAAR